MRFRVELLPEAENDLDEIFEWLQARSPQGAASWHRRWLDVLDELENRADSFGTAPENPRHELDLRQVIFKTRYGKPYRAIFTLKKNTAFVLSIRGHGRDLVDPSTLPSPE